MNWIDQLARIRSWPPVLAAALGSSLLAGCGEAIDGSWVANLSVQAVTPREGPTDGGTRVTLSGTRFCDALTVTVDGEPASDVKVLSREQASAVVPAHARGEAVVAAACGGKAATAAQTYRYVASVIDLAVTEEDPAFAAFADVDGDGWVDRLSETREGVEIRRGLAGGRGFDPTPAATLGPTSLAFDGPPLEVADFTRDGTRDVMLFQWNTDHAFRCHLFAGELGLAEVGEVRIESADQLDLQLLRVVDLDGDGWQDLIVGEQDALGSSVEVSVLHGDGALSFGAKQRLFSATARLDQVFELFEQPAMNRRSGGLEGLDLDGDGLSDLVFNWGGQGWAFVLGRRDRQYPIQNLTLPSGEGGLFFFDTDEKLDRYTVECASPGLIVRTWRGTGLGTFESTPGQYQVDSADWRSHCADLAADGGTLEASFLPRRFDLDGDGHPEFLVAGAGLWSWIELGASTGSLSDVLTLAEGSSSQRNLALVAGPPGTLRVVDGELGAQYLVPSMSGESIAQRPLPPLAPQPATGSCLGDFTGDGIADVMTLREGAAVLFEGTGTGWFDEKPGSAFPVRDSTCATAHLSAGGRADFFTPMAAYLNRGDGGFVEGIPDGVAPGEERILGKEDADGDGVDELVVLAEGSGASSSYLGDLRVLRAGGSAGFESAGMVEGVYLGSGSAPVITDLNGDGLLDIVYCKDGWLMLQYGDAVQRDGSWGDGAQWQLGGGCNWVTMLPSPTGRFLLTSGGSVLRESEGWTTEAGTRSDGERVSRQVHTYDLTSVLDPPEVMQDQVALCDLRGRGMRTDLVFVYDGFYDGTEGFVGIAAETLGAPSTFGSMQRWTIGIARRQLVGCADADGDGLDDVVVADGSGRTFLLRNLSH